MKHHAHTIALTPDWSPQINEDGQFSILFNDDAIAQNCANELKLFRKDAYFLQDSGTDWFSVQLGRKENPSAVSIAVRDCLSKIDGVAKIISVDESFFSGTRTLNLRVSIETKTGKQYVLAV